MAFTVVGLELELSAAALGLMTGLTYGVLAVGLVIVYRSSRVINFAHGEIGAFAAALLSLAVTEWHVPYWAAFPLALGVGAAVGGLSEIVVVRRLRQAPTIMTIIATLGLAQFLLMVSLMLNSALAAGQQYPQPAWLPEYFVGALLMTPAHTAMLVLTPVVVLAVMRFLSRSRHGLAIRAAAANKDAARMAGVQASRMSTVAWAIAGSLAAFTAILVLPTRGFISEEFLGPGLLLRALTAAVVARMVNLPVALGAGLALGVFEQLALWNYPGGGLVEAVLFAVILVALLIQRRQGGREEEKGSWASVLPWQPVPVELLRVWSIRHLGKIAAAVALVVALLVPLFVTHAVATIFVVILSFALVGVSLGIVTGLAGQLSLGQFALAGVGAAASYAALSITGSVVLSLVIAGLVAAVVSLVVGLPALRIKGLMLAVTTLGFALAARSWLLGQSWVLGEGVSPGRPSLFGLDLAAGKDYYFFTLAVFVVGLWLARNVWQGGLGRRLRALRDNEDGARAFTLPATKVKLQGFALAGFLAGLGGAVYGHGLALLSPSAFPVTASINVAAMAVLGGLGVLAGPLVGAFYVIGVPEFVPLDSAGLAASALGWLVLILYFPGGIAQLVRPLRERLIRLLARRAGMDPEELRARQAEVVEEGEDFSVSLTEHRRPVASVAGDRPLLDVRGVSKHYGGVCAVDEVSFAVSPGETVGLIGPNGAGKTTLFEVVSGFVRADGGRVSFDGSDVSALGPAGRGRLGLVRSFQDAALFPTMTVADVVKVALERTQPTYFVPAVVGAAAAERRKQQVADELLGTTGLHRYRDHRVQELSTGTRRVTELACMLALEPKLLLLDEPSSGIAQRETEALGEVLMGLKGYLGMTLVVIEHDIPLVTSISDRLLAMETGSLIADGSPGAVQRDPEVVRSYLGGASTALARSDVPAVGANGATGNDGRCEQTTRKGSRCSRRAVADGRCTQHRQVAGVG